MICRKQILEILDSLRGTVLNDFTLFLIINLYFKVITRQKSEKVFPTDHIKEANEFKLVFKIKIGLIEFSVTSNRLSTQQLKMCGPTTNLKACRFPLGQAWLRKMQSLGFAKPYMKPGEMSEYLKLFFGLPFLRPDEVNDCFVTDIMALLPPNNLKLTAFTDYILEVYVREDSRYPPSG
ncbi:hypothetical protein QTP88_017476 [Uroleucon formosanum]